MTNFIPIFPLAMVVYPGEQLNLHIFEPRYKQLITECAQQQKPFGIPAVIDKHVKDFGTLVQIKEIVKLYDNGEMDIITEGIKIFRVLEFIKEVPDKLYYGAIVNYPDNITNNASAKMVQKVVNEIRELHKQLQVQKDFKKPDETLTSYDIAHHAGFSLQQEYDLLELLQEAQRIEFIKRHLKKVIPLITEMEQLKEKIKLNGHFKNLRKLDFDI
jgi:uncharacterized protein